MSVCLHIFCSTRELSTTNEWRIWFFCEINIHRHREINKPNELFKFNENPFTFTPNTQTHISFHTEHNDHVIVVTIFISDRVLFFGECIKKQYCFVICIVYSWWLLATDAVVYLTVCSQLDFWKKKKITGTFLFLDNFIIIFLVFSG